MPAPLLTRCTLLCSLLLPLYGVAAELYRYVDDKGVTVLSRQGVPPEFIGKGYEVLNDQGRVLRVIPPAPTPEEFARMQADKARASSDAKLLRLYTNLDDVDRARERKLAELDGVEDEIVEIGVEDVEITGIDVGLLESVLGGIELRLDRPQVAGVALPGHEVDTRVGLAVASGPFVPEPYGIKATGPGLILV